MLGLAAAAAELVRRLLGAGAGLCGTARGAGMRGAVHSHVRVYITEAWSNCMGEEDFGMSRNM